MSNKSFCNKISILAVLLLLWNPITLWLLTNRLLISIIIPLVIIAANFLIYIKFSDRIRVWCFNILMIGSVFYHSELVFRINFPDKDIPNLYEIRDGYYFNMPLLNQYFDNVEYSSTYRTNCQGYRIDLETNQSDSLKQCDWLFIGDSYTQGAQVEYSQLYSSLIYRDFNDKTILNAGISGAGICEEFKYYKDEGIKLKPTKIFLQLGVFNDFFNVYERNASWQDYIMVFSSLYRFIEYNLNSGSELPLGRWVEPFSSLIQGNIDYNILYKTSSEQKRNDIKAIENYLDRFNKLAKDNNAELVVLLIPSKEQVSDSLLSEVINAYNINREDLDMTYPSKLMDSLSQKHNFKLIDLYQDFRDSDEFPFFDIDEHMNTIGHEIIAHRIRSEYNDIISPYTYLSESNTNDRYPTIYDDGYNILHQNYSNGKYNIVMNNSTFDDYRNIISSKVELIHPMLSSDKSYLLFTEGNQDNGQTDVILYDLQNNRKSNLTPEKDLFGAIPQFNRAGNKVVYASWKISTKNEETTPCLSIYDIPTKSRINLNICKEECWRPVFWNNDSSLLFISKSGENNKFIVQSYSLKDKIVSTIIERSYDIWDIAVSPSGKYIVYSGNELGNWDLFLHNVEENKDYKLTHSLGNEWDPAFGASDNEIWFAGTSGFNNGIYYLTINESFTNNNN